MESRRFPETKAPVGERTGSPKRVHNLVREVECMDEPVASRVVVPGDVKGGEEDKRKSGVQGPVSRQESMVGVREVGRGYTVVGSWEVVTRVGEVRVLVGNQGHH